MPYWLRLLNRDDLCYSGVVQILHCQPVFYYQRSLKGTFKGEALLTLPADVASDAPAPELDYDVGETCKASASLVNLDAPCAGEAERAGSGSDVSEVVYQLLLDEEDHANVHQQAFRATGWPAAFGRRAFS